MYNGGAHIVSAITFLTQSYICQINARNKLSLVVNYRVLARHGNDVVNYLYNMTME